MLCKGKDLFSSGKEKRHLIIIFTINSRYYDNIPVIPVIMIISRYYEENQDYWLHSHAFPSISYIP